MTENYLPLAYLNAWEYCPRRFYLEYQLGEMEDNEHILIGRYLHRNIDEEGISQEGIPWFIVISGSGAKSAALSLLKNHQPIPWSLKGKMANHLNDHFQLCAAALCLEERTGRSIAMGKFSTTPSAATKVTLHSNYVRQLNRRSQHRWQPGSMPQPIEHPKCQACSLQGICLPFEVKQLLREVFNMSVLYVLQPEQF